MTNPIRSYLIRRAERCLAANQLCDAYLALVLRQEGARRRWYTGTGPAPLFRQLPEELR
jgi:hypothetical protein